VNLNKRRTWQIAGVWGGWEKGKKKKADSDAKLAIDKHTVTVSAVANVVNQAVRWIGLCVIAYCGYLTTKELAGKDTFAQFAVEVFDLKSLNTAISLILAAAALAYGVLQRRLRQRTVKRLSARIRET